MAKHGAININRLPLNIIFQHAISHADPLALNMRLVCKDWKEIYDRLSSYPNFENYCHEIFAHPFYLYPSCKYFLEKCKKMIFYDGPYYLSGVYAARSLNSFMGLKTLNLKLTPNPIFIETLCEKETWPCLESFVLNDISPDVTSDLLARFLRGLISLKSFWWEFESDLFPYTFCLSDILEVLIQLPKIKEISIIPYESEYYDEYRDPLIFQQRGKDQLSSFLDHPNISKIQNLYLCFVMPPESIDSLIEHLPKCVELKTFALSFVSLRTCELSVVKNLCTVLSKLPNLKSFSPDFNYYDATFGQPTNNLETLDDLRAISPPDLDIV